MKKVGKVNETTKNEKFKMIKQALRYFITIKTHG